MFTFHYSFFTIHFSLLIYIFFRFIEDIEHDAHQIPTHSDDDQGDSGSFDDLHRLLEGFGIIFGDKHLVEPIDQDDQRNKSGNSQKPVDQLLGIVGRPLIICLIVRDTQLFLDLLGGGVFRIYCHLLDDFPKIYRIFVGPCRTVPEREGGDISQTKSPYSEALYAQNSHSYT